MSDVKKISTEPFTFTFRVHLNGTVDYTYTRPNLCMGSGQEKSLEAFFKRIQSIHREHSDFYGTPVEE